MAEFGEAGRPVRSLLALRASAQAGWLLAESVPGESVLADLAQAAAQRV